ncbi:TLC domain-containing protein 4-A-like isoform X1 [Branchiostoma lanceolatum]|uniref:TLC domain-containing protein 4-A-like isoform X1 n=2 Tax=Branchiostoma lanceolatum TaxID=7740 RepID=UPI003456974A
MYLRLFPSSTDPLYTYTCLGAFLGSLGIYEVLSPWVSRRVTSCYERLPRAQQFEWNNKITATINDVLCTVFTMYAMFFDDKLRYDDLRSDSHWCKLAGAIILGYFIADILEMFLRPKIKWDTSMFLHHLAAAIMTYVTLFWYSFAQFYGTILMMMEASSPFLNIRNLLLLAGWSKSSRPYTSVSALFVITFFVFRVAIIPPFWYAVIHQIRVNPDVHLPEFRVGRDVGLLTAIVLNALNVYWFTFILAKTKRKLFPLKHKE